MVVARSSCVFFSFIFLIGCASVGVNFSSGKMSSSQALYDKAQKLYQSEKYEEAKEYFHQFLSENPDEPLKTIAMYSLGYCYQMTGDIKEAKSLYHRVVTLGTGDSFWIEVARKRVEEME